MLDRALVLLLTQQHWVAFLSHFISCVATSRAYSYIDVLIVVQIFIDELADYVLFVIRYNLPVRTLLEREFHEVQMRFPVHLIETAAAAAAVNVSRFLLQMTPQHQPHLSDDSEYALVPRTKKNP